MQNRKIETNSELILKMEAFDRLQFEPTFILRLSLPTVMFSDISERISYVRLAFL